MSNSIPPNYQLPPSQPSNSGSSTAVIVAIVLASLFACFLVCGGMMAVLLLPAVSSAREAARRMQCSNNLKQISLALLNYESAFGSLPPAYTVDNEGNLLHSWRTLILPWLEQSPLYQQIDLNKPWDDPTNAFLLDTDLSIFRCPSSKIGKGLTTYQVIDDPSSAFPGSSSVKFSAIVDGTSNTVCVVETDELDAVHWAEPKDQNMPRFLSATKASHNRGRNAAMVDGAVRFLSNEMDSQISQGIVTISGGEIVNLGK